ncbi:hypothetical protein BN7_4509 [Wickerhamomyces ciferrii]|uniref:Mtf2-like C-terminal domain-containing protein n=1 Tax=Wickerhamomyces ciferrii (strain ATCC 14091 / BCRC 22168 / CBS 111 / JCM 3599 / NBRC 0793 / NRRL Y-1031 F-60-10) TaxID=1206466 RepID=K0KU45_WICCF|nr:uncharacterized protein BN7_4509 [Wickerhamomyces ciferrii]CCH44939.1 hypothetical protein BN7_4509 [Wickerhamomyces ciferrii]
MLSSLRIQRRCFSSSIKRLNERITEDSFASFGKNTASKKDTDTFISVFNKIMTYRKETKQTSKGSLQLIFENNLKNNTDQNNNQNQNNMTISTNTSNHDIRDFPLSVSSEIVKNDDLDIHRNLIEEIQKKQELREALKPTMTYLDSIDNDYDLIKIVENYVSIFEQETNSKNFKPKSLITNEFLSEIKLRSATTPEAPIIDQFTLPLIISFFLKNLAIKFDSSLEIISFFQNLKKLNIKAFTFLCTEEVYNEVLERTWHKFKDIKLMDSLITDMKANGIIGDLDTISILGLIINDMELLLDPVDNKNQFYSEEDYLLKKSIERYRMGLMQVV